MIRNRICPGFAIISLTTLILVGVLTVFIGSRIVYPPGGYRRFLQHPRQMDNWGLNIPLFRSNKAYFYEVVTAIFLCHSYKHLVTVIVFALFIMYEMEYCWRPSILLGLLAGVATNCVAVATLDGVPMGMSGVLCALVGIQFAALLIQCSYLRETKGKQFYAVFLFGIVMVVMVASMVNIALLNFVGLSFGLLYGFALYPKLPEANVNANIEKVLKFLAILATVIAVVLAVVI